MWELYPQLRISLHDPGGHHAPFFERNPCRFSRRDLIKTEKASRKWLAFNDVSSGGRIRTSELRVMSGFEA